MKISRPVGPTSPTRADKSGSAAISQSADAPTPAAELEMLGVPDAELTPRVREALLGLIEEIRQLRRDMASMRERVSELETLADRDPMLNVLNRRAFARELDRALAMIDRYDVRASLVFVDLNDLKGINDRRGHAAGDDALVHVADCLTSNVRQTDSVARLGGDEFAILLLQADKQIASAKAAQIAQLIAQAPVDLAGEAQTVSVSWGAVEIRPGVSAQEALNLADEAMYEAKRMK